MKILAVGGGSGGHVTPVVAVLRELKKRDQSVEIRFWCDRKFAPQARSIMHHFDDSVPVETIFSGKLRRYNDLSLWRQLLRPVSIVLPNIRDAFLIGLGFLQDNNKKYSNQHKNTHRDKCAVEIVHDSLPDAHAQKSCCKCQHAKF